MLSLRNRFGIPGVISVIALVFAMTGGAFAAKYVITSTKQIKPSVLKALKGKAGPAGPVGAAGPQGPAGPAGVNGKDGAPGPEGKQGIQGIQGKEGKEGKQGKEGSPWTSGGVLPPGETQTGSWYLDTEATGTTSISFPIPLAGPLGASEVHMIDTSGEELVFNEGEFKFEEQSPTGCGSDIGPEANVANPEAAPGNLCIYVGGVTLGAEMEMASQLITSPAEECDEVGCFPFAGGPGAGAATTGARILAMESAANNHAWGTWAVTAPTP